MERARPRAAFRLGDWLVEPALDRISRGQIVHHLRPRLTDLLVHLAEHAGEVVTKDQILEHVWQRQFVAESVLTRSIADLRRLLDDSADHPRFIETIAKRGYRLLVSGSSPAESLRPAASARSVVVLPFADLSPAHDQEYFCDGLSEELTNGLANVAGLRVVARTSAFAFKGRGIDVREIGARLGVSHVLEGAVQRSGDRVRVTVQLIDARDGCHLWSRQFDRPAGDIFAVEDEIANDAARGLQMTLGEGGEARLMRGRTKNAAAHDLYLKGRYLSARRTFDALRAAAAHFERAVQIDPDYAAAHAAIGECHAVTGFLGLVRARDAFPRAKSAASRARALDPDLGDAYAVLGHETGMYEWRWDEAEAYFLRALELAPGHAMTRVWYSHLLDACGRFAEAIAQTERACDCDPLSPTVQATLGIALYTAGELDRAIDRYNEVLKMDPAFVLARFHLGRAYAVRGDLEAAAEQHEAAAPHLPIALALLASVWRRMGRADRMRAALAELERVARRTHVGPVAWSCAYIGDPEQQLAWLTRAADEHDGTLPLLNTDPAVRDVRTNPAFAAQFARLALPATEGASS